MEIALRQSGSAPVGAAKQSAMLMKITPAIRFASVADAEMLTQLAARTFYDAFAASNSPETMEAYMSKAFTLEGFSEDLADPHANFLIAEVEGAPAGYAMLYDGETPECVSLRPAVEIVRMYVERQFHGSGVARTLMEACLEEAKGRGCRTVYLGVWEHNPRAQAFYRKFGFDVVGTHIFEMGAEAQTDYWMERTL